MSDISILSDSPGNVVQLMLTDSNRDSGEAETCSGTPASGGAEQRRFCYRTPDMAKMGNSGQKRVERGQK